MTYALTGLCAALIGALVARFVLLRLPSHRHSDLTGWLILIEDGAACARHGRNSPEGAMMLARAAGEPTPEERAFVYGFYREAMNSDIDLPPQVMGRDDA